MELSHIESVFVKFGGKCYKKLQEDRQFEVKPLILLRENVIFKNNG